MGLKEENKYYTTFHPDYDYTDFIGKYKPFSMDISDEEEKGLKYETRIKYVYEPGIFLKAYVKANQVREPVALVIEEINRGNCAGIFGDLFQLLDREGKWNF